MAAGFYQEEPENPLLLPLNFVGSPVLGLAETLGEIGVPGFQDLADQPFWDPVRDFQDRHPLLAGTAEFASYFVPYAGWARATRAVPALQGLARAGARLGGESPALRFAFGETARFAPISAGLTALDAAAGKYEDPWEAARNFAFGTALGVPFAAAAVRGGTLNSILSQTPILKQAGNIPFPGGGRLGQTMTDFFGPMPAERAMYGMPDVVQERIGPALREEVAGWGYTTHDRPTRVLRDLYSLRENIRSGARTDIQLSEVEPHIQRYENEVLRERVSRSDSYVNLAVPAETDARRILNQEFTPGAPKAGGRRERLIRQPNAANDITAIGNELQLQPNWIGDGAFFRHRTTQTRHSANRMRRLFGLVPSAATGPRQGVSSLGFRRVRRAVPDPMNPGGVINQIWGIRQERPGGMWILATELPPRAGAKPEDNFERFLYFKTDAPGRFFPLEASWARNLDNPNAPPVTERIPPERLEEAWGVEQRVRKGVSEYLDMALGLREMILSPANFRAFNRDMLRGGNARAMVLGEMAESPAGVDFARIWENYFKPLQFQFRNNPDAAFTMKFWQSIFDSYEGLVHRTMFGDRRLEAGKSVLAQMLGKPPIRGDQAIYGLTKRFFKENPNAGAELTALYRAVNRGATFDQLPNGPAKEYVRELMRINGEFITPGNAAMRELGQREMPTLPEHWGISYNFNSLGSNFVPVMDANGQVVGLGAGRTAQAALARAQKVVRQLETEGGSGFAVGGTFTPDTLRQLPRHVRLAITNPGFIRQRAGLRGYKWDLEEIQEDDWISSLLHNYEARGKWFAERIGRGLTSRELERVGRLDPRTNEVLETRLNSLMGVTGPFDRLQNRALDMALSGALGTNNATRAAAALNRADYALSLGMGNLAFPALNAATIFQTTLAELAAVGRAPLDWLSRHGYLRPVLGGDGKPSGVVSLIGAPLKSLRNGIRIMNQDSKIPQALRERHLKTFEHLANTFRLGPRFIEEFIGQNSSAKALFMGARDPNDMVEGIERLSSWLPASTEKLSRTWSAASAMDMFDSMEKIRGIKWSDEEYAQNVANLVDRTNFLYGPVDRPQVFTTPLGSLFGARKNWFTNYLHLLFEYGGLAKNGQFGPLLFALGGTAGLGGLMAMPLVPGVLDWYTETFHDKDLMESVYEQFGENGDLAFGLPALMGVSFSGAAGAPGADFFGDAEFLSSFVSLRRAENFGQNLARGADMIRLGLDPFGDPIFQQQLARWAAPNSLYKALDVFSDNELTAPSTGRPQVQNLGLKTQLLYSAGFTTTEIERGRAVYERMLRDREFRRRTVQILGEGYYQASVVNDRAQMEEILRAAMTNGVSIDSIMQSAAKRARDDQVDMFGRAIPKDVLDRYPSVLEEQ